MSAMIEQAKTNCLIIPVRSHNMTAYILESRDGKPIKVYLPPIWASDGKKFHFNVAKKDRIIFYDNNFNYLHEYDKPKRLIEMYCIGGQWECAELRRGDVLENQDEKFIEEGK
jgi:hypothetical protein